SGSPVLNASTHEVEGILVRGEIDFVYKNGCLASKRCDQNACRGEDVTLITHTLPYIPEQLDEPTAPEEPSRVEFAVAVNLDIPDYSHRGVTSSVVINEAPNGRQVKVKVDIQHSWRGDLLVSLVSPDGQEVVLSNRQGWSADNLVGVFGEDLVAE